MTITACSLVLLPPWDASSSTSNVGTVLGLTRDKALAGLQLRSDRTPATIHVYQDIGEVPMTAWQPQSAAIAKVRIGAEACYWCQLAYQFAHELCHVLANSWSAEDGRIEQPCHWVEELVCEAFSQFALARLAPAWRSASTLGHPDYASAVEKYRADFQKSEWPAQFDPAAYHQQHKVEFAAAAGVVPAHYQLAYWLSKRFEADPILIEDVPALNRWPKGSATDLPIYFALWIESCRQIGSSGALPQMLSKVCA